MRCSVLILIGLVSILTGCAKAAVPLRDITIQRADGGPVTFHVEIADELAEWEYGLMERQSLAERHGMLFLFPQERMLTFWMKNTPLFLDIVFIDSTNRIVSIHARARPYDETMIASRKPAQKVLELQGGEAARFGLKAGDRLVMD